MNCNRKCNECGVAKEVCLVDILSKAVESSVEKVAKEYQGKGTVETVIPTILEMCEKNSYEVVEVRMHPEYLVHVMYFNHIYLQVDEESALFKVKPEYSKGMDITVVPDSKRRLVDVDVRDMGLAYAGENIIGLVEHLMNDTNQFRGIRMSTQTLDSVLAVLLREYKLGVSILSNTMLIPCSGGVKVVVVDETLKFGMVRFTDKL